MKTEAAVENVENVENGGICIYSYLSGNEKQAKKTC